MRALLDVNVLVALLDEGHLHHRAACQWLEQNRQHGWASCPLTQDGCLRILCQPSYSNSQPMAIGATRLSDAVAEDSHEFWLDSFSLLGKGRLRWDRLLTSRRITDTYLLALATERGGRLVTFDRGMSIAAVTGASAEQLVTLTLTA